MNNKHPEDQEYGTPIDMGPPDGEPDEPETEADAREELIEQTVDRIERFTVDKWTPEYVDTLLDKVAPALAIAAAHNAELADEQEKTRQAERKAEDLSVSGMAACGSLMKELDAERERNKALMNIIEHVPCANTFGGSGEAYGILTDLALMKRKLAKAKGN